MATRIENGHLIPDVDTIRDILKKLGEDAQAEPALLNRIKRNPGEVLGERGLSEPIQHELLRERGSPGYEAECFPVSCICSSCNGITLSFA
jgi:hypothetical protein